MMNRFQLKKVLKRAIGLVLTPLLFFSANSFAQAQAERLYVTIGSSDNISCPGALFSAEENGLKPGLEWAVFGLNSGYRGTARVSTKFCSSSGKNLSILTPNNFSQSAHDRFLLIRPIPKNSSRIKPKAISCSRLPSAVLQEIDRQTQRIKYSNTKYFNESCYTFDLDLDGTPDVVNTKIVIGQIAVGHELILARSGTSWITKYRRDWSWE